MNEEVLVVDDHAKTAESVANYVQTVTGLAVVATSNPTDALAIMKTRAIKVAVLDQRMPEKAGTVLSQELRAVDGGVRLIMFSGKASADDVREAAFNIKFNEVLKKGDVDRLAEVVFQQYLEYRLECQQRLVGPVTELYRSPKRYGFFGPQVIFSLIGLRVLQESFVDEGGWQTVLHLTRGQEDKRGATWSSKYAVTIEEQSQTAIKMSTRGRINVSVGHIQTALEQAIAETHKSAVVVDQTGSLTREVTYKISDQESNVRSRHLQRAPVYRVWAALIRIECDRCGNPREERILIHERLPAFATRQVDYCDDGTQKTHSTGIVEDAFD
ncbi:response regulator [Krasilnikovia sp. M28-CT-15]|uniref:response regulator n=1 Tax=Krasilnikovia sp. M28-CT-15 TaxID=3373540 RepID=UPI003876DCFD